MNEEEIMLEAELRRVKERELDKRQWEDAMDCEQLQRENERLRTENEQLRKELKRIWEIDPWYPPSDFVVLNDECEGIE